MLTIAITGGTGFIGRALVNAHLANGDKVRVLTRKPKLAPYGSKPYLGDLMRHIPYSFTDGVDIVYHLGAEKRDKSLVYEVNSHGTQRLLDRASGRCGRWIQLSTVGVYGPPNGTVAIKENYEPRPANDYEASKLDADLRVIESCSKSGLSWGILRPSNVVGQTMTNQSAFALAKSVISGKFIFIGSPRAVSTYIHVDDVVNALIKIGRGKSGTIINYSSDCSWISLVEQISKRAGCPMPRYRIPKAAARLIALGFGKLPNFPLTKQRIDSLSRLAGYPIDLARESLRLTPILPMPEGFNTITDKVLSER